MPRWIECAGEWHQLKRIIPELKDKIVLDLGCGYGWHCKYAIQQGACYVVGIDESHRMIEKAHKINDDSNIHYQICRILDYDFPQNTYDFVISNLVLHYIEDLDDVYQHVYKTLKQNGEFVFNIEHPTFTAGVNQEWIYDEEKILYWPIDNYYYPGKRETNFLGHQVTKYHHTLTQILNGLIQNGFQIEVIEEVMPSKEMMNITGMKDEMRRPMMLLVKAIKK